jgi:methylated-DNA-protein-cysteine methyltransferase-like protein
MEMKPSKSRHTKNPENESFFEKVYAVTRLIPCGRVTNYGAIARYLGSAQSVRMVGWALNSCHHISDVIPAHRVVNRNGLLTGKIHFGGPTIMQQLLENEGVRVEDDKVADFDKLFWDPNKELNNPDFN